MTEWGDARCIGQRKLFYDERPSRVAAAKLICSSCPLKVPCLTFALEHKEAWGVWGETDYRERRIIAASRGYEPPTREEVEHGTERGWAWHRRQREKNPAHDFCQPCLDAYNVEARRRMAVHRKRRDGIRSLPEKS